MAKTTAPCSMDESMSLEIIMAFLSSHGIPWRFCEAFKGAYTPDLLNIQNFHNMYLLRQIPSTSIPQDSYFLTAC